MSFPEAQLVGESSTILETAKGDLPNADRYINQLNALLTDPRYINSGNNIFKTNFSVTVNSAIGQINRLVAQTDPALLQPPIDPSTTSVLAPASVPVPDVVVPPASTVPDPVYAPLVPTTAQPTNLKISVVKPSMGVDHIVRNPLVLGGALLVVLYLVS